MENKQANWWRPAMTIFARFSAWILFPLLIGIPLGQWLDKKYGTEPWLFLISVGISFIISTLGLILIAVKEFQKIEKEENNKNH